MTEFDQIVRTPERLLDESMRNLCKRVSGKRARTVIDHILQHGIITNEDLSELYGYDHPPRAIRDVRDNGIPLITYNVVSPKTGRRMGAYTFGDPSKIKSGRVGGRRAFPKQFKQKLIAHYGPRDMITNELLDERYLQIDHRVPYEVAGDNKNALDPLDFMLLDASSNRAKSWSCERCNNFTTTQDPEICKECFWASPEKYLHIAESQARRVDLIWRGKEILDFESIKSQSECHNLEISQYIKRRLSE